MNMLKGLAGLKDPINGLVREIEALKEEMKLQTEILKEIRDK